MIRKLTNLLLLLVLALAFAMPALAAIDEFGGVRWMTFSAPKAAAITPHDTNELTNVCRAVWVGGAGNLKATMVDSGTVTLTGVPAGTMLPIRPLVVFSTGTTATNLTCLW